METIKYQARSGAVIDVVLTPGHIVKGSPQIQIVQPATGMTWEMGEAALQQRIVKPEDVKPMDDATFEAVLARLGLKPTKQGTVQADPKSAVVSESVE